MCSSKRRGKKKRHTKGAFFSFERERALLVEINQSADGSDVDDEISLSSHHHHRRLLPHLVLPDGSKQVGRGRVRGELDGDHGLAVRLLLKRFFDGRRWDVHRDGFFDGGEPFFRVPNWRGKRPLMSRSRAHARSREPLVRVRSNWTRERAPAKRRRGATAAAALASFFLSQLLRKKKKKKDTDLDHRLERQAGQGRRSGRGQPPEGLELGGAGRVAGLGLEVHSIKFWFSSPARRGTSKEEERVGKKMKRE